MSDGSVGIESEAKRANLPVIDCPECFSVIAPMVEAYRPLSDGYCWRCPVCGYFVNITATEYYKKPVREIVNEWNDEVEYRFKARFHG